MGGKVCRCRVHSELVRVFVTLCLCKRVAALFK